MAIRTTKRWSPLKTTWKKNFDGSFNILAENDKLEQLADEDLPDHFQEVAIQFKNASTDLDRFEFLFFALKLVMADGEITTDERISFASLAELWGVELEPFLRTATYLIKGPHIQNGQADQ
jgi:hypothetical protein